MSMGSLKASLSNSLLNSAPSKLASIKKQQASDAQLIKQVPLQIVRSNSMYSMGENDNEQPVLSKEILAHPAIIDNSEEIAHVDDFEIMQRINQSSSYYNNQREIQSMVELTCKQYFHQFSRQIESLQGMQHQLQADIKEVYTELQNMQKAHYKKIADKIKVMFDNQVALDQAINRLKESDINSLRSRVEELTSIINKDTQLGMPK